MKFTRDKLKQLQALNLPRMQASDIASIKEPGPEADARMAKLDEYLKGFINSKDGKCICCKAQQGAKDPIDGLLNARFVWGLVHGEGICSKCGYPARAKHYIGESEDQIRMNVILQYHPDELSFGERKKQPIETEAVQ